MWGTLGAMQRRKSNSIVTSMIPTIFVVVLVAIALACLSFAWTWNSKEREQAKIALGLSALEDSLLASLAKTVMPEGPVDLNGTVLDEKFQHQLRAEQVLTLTRDFSICTTYPSDDCGYKLRFTYDPKRFSYSYEVTSAFSQLPLSLKADGRNTIARPPSSLPSGSTLSCDPRTSLGANGYSVTSGLSCLMKPEQMCKPGTLPRGLSIDGEIPRLEFVCGDPSKVARCPAQYSLEKVDTRSLASDGKVNATCVRTALATISPPTEVMPAGRLSGRVCPYGYKSASSCSLVNVIAKPGRCGGRGAVVQPVAGKIEFVENATIGFVDCAVRAYKQTCGAAWSAQAYLKIRCVLDQPERVNVQ